MSNGAATDGTFDYEGLLRLLEVFRLPAIPLPPPNTDLAQWVWPPLRSYNGFSGEERIRVWQVQGWAQDQGLYPKPTICSVCGCLSQIGFHSENYYDLWASISLCRDCHKTVHQRFWHAAEWSAFQAQHGGRLEPQWFEVLPSEPVNLADWLKTHQTPGASSLAASVEPS